MAHLMPFDPVEFARSSVVTAYDQVYAHHDIEDSIMFYFDNLRDTLVDHEVTDQFIIEEAEDAFWHECCIRGYVRPECR